MGVFNLNFNYVWGFTDSLFINVGSICQKHFCHLLWGCRKTPAGCLGCLNKFTGKLHEKNLENILVTNTWKNLLTLSGQVTYIFAKYV